MKDIACSSSVVASATLTEVPVGTLQGEREREREATTMR
jgi:hypothetical protein